MGRWSEPGEQPADGQQEAVEGHQERDWKPEEGQERNRVVVRFHLRVNQKDDPSDHALADVNTRMPTIVQATIASRLTQAIRTHLPTMGRLYRATRGVTSRSHNGVMTDREAAWGAVHDALPAGWTVGPPTYDFGVPGWSVTARSLAHGRNRPPKTVTGTGADEIAALRPWTTASAVCRSLTAHGWPSVSGGSGLPTSRVLTMKAPRPSPTARDGLCRISA